MIQQKCIVPACKVVATEIDPLLGPSCKAHRDEWMKSHSRQRAMSQVSDFVGMKDAEIRNERPPEGEKKS